MYLDLTNCCVTDKEMVHLAPFMLKFEKVILNGKQTLTRLGWSTLKNTFCRMSEIPDSIKLQSLELKVEKRKRDMIKEGKQYLYKMGDITMGNLEEGEEPIYHAESEAISEFDGKPMDGESLKVIAEFLPMLEEVYLDNVFTEPSLVTKLRSQSVTRNLLFTEKDTDPWRVVMEKIKNVPQNRRKLKCLSINGCQINDSKLMVIAPALVLIEKVRLAENPDITENGWKFLNDQLTNDIPLKSISLHICTPKNKFIIKNDDNLIELANLLSNMEAADISGQDKEVVKKLVNHLCETSASERNSFKLKSIAFSRSDCDLAWIQKLQYFCSYVEEDGSFILRYKQGRNFNTFNGQALEAVNRNQN